MTIRFQQLNSENYEQAFILQELCHQFPWSKTTFADCLTAPYVAFQAYNDNQAVGYYVGLMVLDEATLMDIGVSPTCRNQGLGNTLLTHFMQQCDQRAMNTIFLEVRASNLPALALYRKQGFFEIERRKDYYPGTTGREDAIMMKWEKANN